MIVCVYLAKWDIDCYFLGFIGETYGVRPVFSRACTTGALSKGSTLTFLIYF